MDFNEVLDWLEANLCTASHSGGHFWLFSERYEVVVNRTYQFKEIEDETWGRKDPLNVDVVKSDVGSLYRIHMDTIAWHFRMQI